MFSRSIFVTLFALALSVQAIPANRQQNAQCGTTSTVVRTVTVTARGAAATTAKSTAKGATNNANTATTTKASNKAGNAGSQTTSTKAAAQTTAAANTGNPQTSLTLDPRVIAPGFANNGQDVPTAGQVASLTSTNNFINFCLTVPNLPITNGKQITTGSCNPAPIGLIPSVDNMPSSKFTFPANFGTIKANTAFTVEMAIQNMQTGFFVNAQENYFSAPQQLNGAGQIKGHSHVVIESLSSIGQTTPTDPKKFTFFKGLNAAASGGKLTADVTAGLAAGFYKLSSINTAANHQPVIVPVAQHGSLDDAIYFTVTADGKPLAAANGGNKVAATTAPAATAKSTASVKGAVAATSVSSAVKGAATVKAASTAKAASTSAAAASAATAKGNGKVLSPATPVVAKNGAKVVSSAAPAKTSSAAAKSNGRNKRALNRQA